MLAPPIRSSTAEAIARERLNAWASWFGRGKPEGPKQPSCTLGRIQNQRVAAGNVGGQLQVPPEVDEVEAVVLRLNRRERHIIRTYYIEYSTMEQKARDCCLSRSGYWRALTRVERLVYAELY